MGKPIEVAASTIVGDVLLLDTDRSITGQDGVGYESAEAAAADEPDTTPLCLDSPPCLAVVRRPDEPLFTHAHL